MKKLLLSLLMIVGYAALASADEAVFDFQSETYDDMFAEKVNVQTMVRPTLLIFPHQKVM